MPLYAANDDELVDAVREGRAFLFLGAGASLGATHADGLTPPGGKELADMLAQEFLGSEYKGLPLAQIAELAVSESDLTTVQEYIAEIYNQ